MGDNYVIRRAEFVEITDASSDHIRKDKRTILKRAKVKDSTDDFQSGYLLKELVNQALRKQRYISRFTNEIAVYRGLHHKNIATFIGSREEQKKYLFVLKCDFRCTAWDLLQNEPQEFDRQRVLCFSIQISDAVRYLQDREDVVLHGDIRAHNVFVTNQRNHQNQPIVQLAEFSHSKAIRGGDSSSTTTNDAEADRRFRCLAPEVMSGKEVSKASDMWGLILFILVLHTKRAPYHDITKAQLMKEVYKGNLPLEIPKETDPPGLADVFREGLSMEPDERPGIRQVLSKLQAL